MIRWLRHPTDMSRSRGPKMNSRRRRSGQLAARTMGSTQLGWLMQMM